MKNSDNAVSYDDDEDALKDVVETLWDEYDDDGNGYLDMDETRNFIVSVMT